MQELPQAESAGLSWFWEVLKASGVVNDKKGKIACQNFVVSFYLATMAGSLRESTSSEMFSPYKSSTVVKVCGTGVECPYPYQIVFIYQSSFGGLSGGSRACKECQDGTMLSKLVCNEI